MIAVTRTAACNKLFIKFGYRIMIRAAGSMYARGIKIFAGGSVITPAHICRDEVRVAPGFIPMTRIL
jgi:hypothetical protein